jgi:hypothetical protein
MFLIVISALSFIAFGFTCIFFESLKTEFERYGLSQYRKLVGFLEILGGAGQLLGLFFYEPLLSLSSLCLFILMCCGVFVRAKIGDPFFQWIPALILLILNALILYDIFF